MIYDGDNGGNLTYEFARPNDTEFHHCALTYDGGGASGSYAAYVDGVSVSKSTVITTLTALDGFANAVDLTIGERADDVGPWDGVIDEFIIYNRALTASKVAALYWADAPRLNYTVATNQLLSGAINIGKYPARYDTNGVDTIAFSSDLNTHFPTGEEIAEVQDVSGNGNHGTLEPSPATGPTWQASTRGVGGGEYSFDGSGDYIEVPDDDSLDFGTSTDISMMAWVKTPDLASYRTIFQKGISSPTYQLRFNPSGQIESFIHSGGLVTSPLAYDDGQWHHIATTGERGGAHALYVDGVEVASATCTLLSIDNANTLLIGGRGSPVGLLWNGEMDDPRIYRSALSSNQVYEIAVNGTAPTNTPVLWMPFDREDNKIKPQVGSTITVTGGVTQGNR